MKLFEYFIMFIIGTLIITAGLITHRFNEQIKWCEERSLIPVRVAAFTHTVVCVDRSVVKFPNTKDNK